LQCSLQYERPSAAPRPNQGSIAAAEYAQIKRNRSSPSNGHPQQNDEQPKSKKSSTGTLSHGSMSMKRGLPRQKQHYIYNVTDDRPAFDRNVRKRGRAKSQNFISNIFTGNPDGRKPPTRRLFLQNVFWWRNEFDSDAAKLRRAAADWHPQNHQRHKCPFPVRAGGGAEAKCPRDTGDGAERRRMRYFNLLIHFIYFII
jgi:hypothetical protein